MDMGEAKELLLSVRRRHTVGSLVCDADAVTSTSGEHTNRGVLRRNSTYSNSSHWRGLRQYLNHRKPSYTAIPLDSTSEDAEGQDQDGSSAFQNGGGQGKKVLLLKAVRVILPYFNSEGTCGDVQPSLFFARSSFRISATNENTYSHDVCRLLLHQKNFGLEATCALF